MTFEIDQVYCDNAATTPVTPEVLDEMIPFFTESFGNPSSLYMLSQESRAAIEFSRDKIAKTISSNSSEIIFTSGGTESNNLAIKGICLPKISNEQNEIIISSIEHHAIIHPAEQLKNIGYKVKYSPIDQNGLLKIDEFTKLINNKTKFVSIMLANNEIGSLQDIKSLVAIVREKETEFGTKIYFHTDAVQAVGKININVSDLNIDLLSISGHKFNAPKGIGALYIKDGITIEPLLDGGGQERQNRSGTENVPSIVGLGKAIEIAEARREDFFNHTKNLTEKFIDLINKKIPDIVLHSSIHGLSNIVNFSIPNIQGEPILIGLDFKGIMASSGSACSTASVEPSHVLLAKGVDEKLALGSVRLSFSISNTLKEIDYIVESIYEVCEDLKN
jgi:cysteine desulfurase